MKYIDAISLQKEIAKKVDAKDGFGRVSRICGVDVAYEGDAAYCSAVIFEGRKEIESADLETSVTFPYVPSLLMLRETGPVLQAIGLLKKRYDLLLVDGHGMLHPRRCGLACYVGVLLDKPTIGVAKSRLCGIRRSDGFMEVNGEILGYALSNKLYVSVGHKISLKTAIEFVKKFGIDSLRLADKRSKEQKRKNGLRS